MNPQSILLAGLLSWLVVTGTATAQEAKDIRTLVPEALEDGTLANQQLRSDALAGVHARLASRGCRNPHEFTPFVTRRPAGKVGQRNWQETWVARCDNGLYPVRIEFREAGMGAAEWSVP